MSDIGYEVFGEATPNFLRLIHHHHPFPFLVEQEERWHGALLAYTSNGALLRVLESFDVGGGSMGLMRNNFFRTLGMGIEDENPPEGVISAIQHGAAKLTALARNCHEVFARYLSYAECAKHREFDGQLSTHFQSARERFPFMCRLTEVFGDPLDPTTRTKAGAAHLVAKIALSTNELWKLLDQPTHLALAEKLKSGDYFDQLRPLARAELIVNRIHERRLMEDADELSRIPHDDPFNMLTTQLDKAIWDEACSALLESHTPLRPLRSTGYLSSQAILLGHRLEAVCPGYCHGLESGHVGLTTGVGQRIELDPRLSDPNGEPLETWQSIKAVILNDPSLAVWYETRIREGGEWTYCKPDEVHQRLAPSGRCIVYFLDAPPSQAYCLFITGQGKDTVGVVAAYESYENLFDHIYELKQRLELTFLLLPLALPGPTVNADPRLSVAKWLKSYGHVVFWRLLGRAAYVAMGTTVAYITRTQPVTDTDDPTTVVNKAIKSTRPLGLIEIGDDFCSLSSAPSYIIKITDLGIRERLRRVGHDSSAQYLVRTSEGGFNTIGEDALVVSQDLMAAAMDCYDTLYGVASLPGPLPLHDARGIYDQLRDYFE